MLYVYIYIIIIIIMIYNNNNNNNNNNNKYDNEVNKMYDYIQKLSLNIKIILQLFNYLIHFNTI